MVCVDLDPPTAPNNLTAEVVGRNVNLVWEPATDIPSCSYIAYCNIYLDGVKVAQLDTGLGQYETYTGIYNHTLENLTVGNHTIEITAVDAVAHEGPPISTTVNIAQLYEYYHAPSLWAGSVYACKYRAQVFTIGINGPNERFIISSVKLFYQKGLTGNPSQVIVSLNSTDTNGKPTGPDLSIGTIEGSEWKTNEWTEIFMSPYVLQPSTQYAIVVKSPNSDSANYVGLDGYGPYAGYNALYSGDCGSSWSSMALGNYIFEVWGEPVVAEGFFEVLNGEIIPSPSPAQVGEEVTIYVKIINTGEVKDDLRWELKDQYDNLLDWGEVADVPLHSSYGSPFVFPVPSFIMPNYDVIATFTTFHLVDGIGWIQDSTQSFPITFIPEGFLDITQIVIKDTEVFPTPNPVSMSPGEKAQFNIRVKNLGVDDHFKFEMWANEGESDFLIYGPVEFDCPAGIEDWIFPDPGLVLTMGDTDVVIITKTFHLEEGEPASPF